MIATINFGSIVEWVIGSLLVGFMVGVMVMVWLYSKK
jgi:hypothetical protein